MPFQKSHISLPSRKSSPIPGKVRLFLVMILMMGGAAAGCTAGDSTSNDPLPLESTSHHVQVLTGAQVLAESNFREWAGLRVGLIVNHTSLIGDRHLIDLVHEAPDVSVSALFGPEHGLRGQAGAGEAVEDAHDQETGAPVFSLYGQVRRPTPQMLKDVDVLVFDIQDIGARFYTYISTMGLAMQSAAEAGIPFYVLDRPNPLGGESIAGFMRDEDHESFVGQYPIPVQHGLTIGELARMIQGNAWLPGLEKLELHVVEMEGWNRAMLWPETGLDWVAPSPNIPTFETALIYPGTCFFEATSASEGRGTDAPFLTIGAPWLRADSLASRLSHPGVQFLAGKVVPRSIPGAAPTPKLESVELETIEIRVLDADDLRAVELGIDMLVQFRNAAPDSVRASFLNERWLGLLTGSEQTLELILSGASGSEIASAWADDVEAFRSSRTPWLLYD